MENKNSRTKWDMNLKFIERIDKIKEICQYK